MKTIINVEVELDNEFVESWNKDFLSYHTNLYKSEEKVLEENPIEKAIASQIEDWLYNYLEGMIGCKANVVNYDS